MPEEDPILELHALLAYIAHMRLVTGHPFWPLEAIPLEKPPQVLAAQEMQVNMTRMRSHTSSPVEVEALAERNRELKRRLDRA